MIRDKKAFLSNLTLGVGMALAVSCFAVLSQMFNHQSGIYTPYIILLAGSIAYIVAKSVGELSLMYPGAFGIWTYIRNAWGNFIGLGVVLGYVIMLLLVAGIEGKLLGQIFSVLFNISHPALIVTALFLFVMGINWYGLNFSKRAQIGMVLLLVFISLLLALLVWIKVPEESANSAIPAETALDSLLEMLIIAFFLFVGFEWTTNSANTSRKAAGDIPKVLTASIAVLVVYYFLFSVSMQVYLNHDTAHHSMTPHVSMATYSLGESGSFLIFVLSSLAVLSSFNVGLIGATRLIYAVAREGYLPESFSSNINRHGVPVWPLLFLGTSGLVIAVFCAIAEIDVAILSEVAALIICLIYAILLHTALRLRTLHGEKVSKQQKLLPAPLINIVTGLMVTVIVAIIADKGWSFEIQFSLTVLFLVMVCAGLMIVNRYNKLFQKEKSQ